MRHAAKDKIGGNRGLVASAELAFFRAAANERRFRCTLRLQEIHHFVDSRTSSEKFLHHLGVWEANKGTPMLFNDETRRYRLCVERSRSRRRVPTASFDDEGRKYTPACCFTQTRAVISNIRPRKSLLVVYQFLWQVQCSSYSACVRRCCRCLNLFHKAS